MEEADRGRLRDALGRYVSADDCEYGDGPPCPGDTGVPLCMYCQAVDALAAQHEDGDDTAPAARIAALEQELRARACGRMPMQFSEYQQCAERTMIDTADATDLLLSAILGLCGEAAEVATADMEQDGLHVLDECGDLLWYAAQWCKAHGETLASFVPRQNAETREACLMLLWHATGKLADMTKKLVFHQKPIDALERHLALDSVVCSINTMLGFYGWSIEEACAHNNDKLLRRFPSGFTSADANARKDEAGNA